MVFKNDRGYNINSISNNDNYLVLSLNISRSEQKLFYLILKEHNKLKSQIRLQIFQDKILIKMTKNIFTPPIMIVNFII